MQKCPRETVTFNHEVWKNWPYCRVIKFDNTYVIEREIDGVILVWGKELKGYIDDIIYPQFTGEKYWTGDFILNSDRHGMICKWKEESK